MSALTGTGHLLRLALRLDRVRLAVWILSLATLAYVQVEGLRSLYTPEELARFAETTRGNAALIVLAGEPVGIETLGGRTMWELAVPLSVALALMASTLVNRHTRVEEEHGRTELLAASVLGRRAVGAAAFGIVAATSIVIGAIVAAVLVSLELPVAGALVAGASFAGVGLVFAGVALVSAQITEHARAATGLTGAVLGASYVLRGVGDVTVGALSWLSPLAWPLKAHAFVGNRWAVLLLPLVTTVLLVLLAWTLSGRRDVGAGLIPQRPGPREAAEWLGTPLGVALRLQRGALVGWAVGLALGGVALGAIADSAEDLVADNEDVAEWLIQAGNASLTDLFLATTVIYLAVVSAGFAIQSALRLRSEETAGRAEPVLATGVSRVRWAASHGAVTAGGTLLVLAAGGLTVGLAHALVIGDLTQVPRLLGASLVSAPAVWVLGGIGVALFGVLPRATPLVWAGLAFSAVVTVFGPLLDPPEWVVRLSPFEHIGTVPAASPEWLALGVLTALAAALYAAGLAGFGHRDVNRS